MTSPDSDFYFKEIGPERTRIFKIWKIPKSKWIRIFKF